MNQTTAAADLLSEIAPHQTVTRVRVLVGGVTEVAVPWRVLGDAGHQVVFATEQAGAGPGRGPPARGGTAPAAFHWPDRTPIPERQT